MNKKLMFFDNIIFSPTIAKQAFRMALACILAVLLALWLHAEYPFWAAISAFTVMKSSSGSSLKRCFERIFATFSGAILALIVASLFISNSLVLLISIFIIVTIWTAHSYRHESYIDLLGAITFVLVIFNAYTEPNDLINTAFFRCFEVIIGIIAQVIVNILIFPDHACVRLGSLEKETAIKYFDFIDFVLNNHINKDSNNSEFLTKYDTLLDCLKKLVTLRSEAKFEKILPWTNSDNSLEIEENLMLGQQLLTHYYYNNHTDKRISASVLNDIIAVFRNAKQIVINLCKNTITTQSYNQHVLAVIKEFTIIYDSYKPTTKPELILLTKMILNQLLITTQPLQKSPELEIEVKKISHPVTRFIEFIDLKQGIKASLAAISVPIIWIMFNLPGISQVAISAIILIRTDQEDTENTARLRLGGAIMGAIAGFAFIGLDISNFALYLLTSFAAMFVFSYMFHSNSKTSYMPLQAVCAFAVSVFIGFSPTTIISPGLERTVGIILGVICSVLINATLWPVSRFDMFKLQIAQIQEKLSMIAYQGKQNILSITEKQLHDLYQLISQIRNAKYQQPITKNLHMVMRDICHNLAMILTCSSSVETKLPLELTLELHKTLSALETVAGSIEKTDINKRQHYKSLLRSNFTDSERLLASHISELNKNIFALQNSLAQLLP